MDINRAAKGFAVFWVISALLSLGVVGVLIWAIVRLVSKFA